MTHTSLHPDTRVRAPSQRADALADRLEQGAHALAAFATSLTDAEWKVPMPHDGRAVGVIVHHVASVYPIEIQLAQAVADGKPVIGLTMDDIDAMNARHAAEHAAVTRQASLELLRANSGRRGRDSRAERRAARPGGAGVAVRRCPAHVPVRARGSRGPAQLSPSHPPAAGGAAVAAQGDAMTTTANTTTASGPAPSIKTRQQAMWPSGDFAVIGTTLQIVGENLCEAIDLRAGERVPDLAAGNGNATLAAARRFARVTSTDYVPALLERGRARAGAEGLDVTFEVADAEALPYPSATFDVVLSTFGVMFAPDHAQSASELRRVCRLGGRIGLASWTPEGFLGELLRVVATYVPPPPGVRSPLLWGTRAHVQDLFADAVSIEHTVRYFAFRYESPAHWIDIFRQFYGPVHKAFAALDTDGQASFEADLIALLRRADRGGAGGLVVPGEYLETVIIR